MKVVAQAILGVFLSLSLLASGVFLGKYVCICTPACVSCDCGCCCQCCDACCKGGQCTCDNCTCCKKCPGKVSCCKKPTAEPKKKK